MLVTSPSTACREETKSVGKLFGRTVSGRYLVVVFTVRRSGFRTVTAYTMNQAERSIYAPEIEA